jgi:hypothetical protein
MAWRNEVPKNVLMKDGNVRRVDDRTADQLMDSGQAKRFVSNAVRRAMKLGIEVKNFGINDKDLKSQIDAARKKAEDKAHKAAQKKAAKEENNEE